MSKDLILTNIRLTLLETQVYNTEEKRDIYLGAIQRIAIELQETNTEESLEMSSFIEEFVKKQKEVFSNIKSDFK